MTNVDEKYANQVPVFFFPWRSHYSEWLRAVLSAHPGVCLLAPHPHRTPLCPLQISSMLIPNAILPPRAASSSSAPPPPFFKVHPRVTGFQLQLLLVSLLSAKSTSPEATYQNLLQREGRLKLSGMTCGLDGSAEGGGFGGCVVVVAAGGNKCMANLRDI